MKTLVTVYADKPDFNHGNALVLYSITNIAKHYGYKTIIVSKEDLPVPIHNSIKIVSYINTIPNIIVEKWIQSMNISIVLSELLHELNLSDIICYGVSCVLASTPIKKIADIRIIYSPSIVDISTIREADNLVSKTFAELLQRILRYTDLIFDYKLDIKQVIDVEKTAGATLVNNPETLEKLLFKKS